MAQTLQDQFALGLTRLGEHEVQGKSGKYRTFTRAKGGFYFLGRSGALRVGACSSRSQPCNEAFKAHVQQKAHSEVTLEDLGL